MKKFVIALALVACLALLGCGSSGGTESGAEGGGTMVETAKDNASVVACRTNRAQIEQAYAVAQAQSTGESVSFASIISELKVTCPSGGVYSWDQGAQKSKCSVHGE